MGVLYRSILCACLVVEVVKVNCSTTTTPPPNDDSSEDTTSEQIGDQLATMKRRLETLSTELEENRKYFITQLQQTKQEIQHLHQCPRTGQWCRPNTCTNGNSSGQDTQGLKRRIKTLTSKIDALAQDLTQINVNTQTLLSLYGKLDKKLTQQQESLYLLTQGQNEAREASVELNTKVDQVKVAVDDQQDDLDKLSQGQATPKDGLHNLTDAVDMLIDMVTNFTTTRATNCREATQGKGSGVYQIWITPSLSRYVYCEGDWTVIQRRMNGQVNFFRKWEDYRQGFGNVQNEYWLGLETVHEMTYGGCWQLRVDLGNWDGSTAYALYSGFKVGPETDYYRLTYDSYDGGTAGDSFSTTHKDRAFSTMDQDHDVSQKNCAVSYSGAWWYKACHWSNLNGLYKPSSKSDNSGIIWKSWKGFSYSLKSSVMKIRPL